MATTESTSAAAASSVFDDHPAPELGVISTAVDETVSTGEATGAYPGAADMKRVDDVLQSVNETLKGAQPGHANPGYELSAIMKHDAEAPVIVTTHDHDHHDSGTHAAHDDGSNGAGADHLSHHQAEPVDYADISTDH